MIFLNERINAYQLLNQVCLEGLSYKLSKACKTHLDRLRINLFLFLVCKEPFRFWSKTYIETVANLHKKLYSEFACTPQKAC